MANLLPYIQRLGGECCEKAWSAERFPNGTDVEALVLSNEHAFLTVLRRQILGQNAELYNWQRDC
jgi:hypothetical protein